ncbi:PQQ-binding-like beta-propeller repeat protein [Streptomyces sp. NPDC048637]|uniref:outer membrane protein assembly factor BamB family protein n=1 Tax=Streptomyces sp. NPDC048637 TaxID=3155636 RepID=UPI00342EE04C
MVAVQPLQDDDPQSLGDYRLVARLGAGGMGRVYLARTSGGRTFAVKVVRPELAEDPDFRRRFQHEVSIARSVSGPYTAAVVDADTEAALPWLTTAYVLGPALDDVIGRHGTLPEASVRALGAGLAAALTGIHAAGLVHRDLKPSNVLLAADGPRVIDFGIARAVDGERLTSTGVVVGSPGFIPPEQATGQVAGTQGDVFSLGVVLAYAASGRQPFGTGTAAGMLYQVVHGEPDLTGVPEALRPLVQQCLAKDPRMRPTPERLVAELAPDGVPAALEHWLPGPVASTIAQHAARILELDTPVRDGEMAGVRTPTVLDQGTAAEPTRTAAVAPEERTASRRGFLALGAGAAVLAAGGGAAWAWQSLGGEPTHHKRRRDDVIDPADFTTPPAGTSPKPLWDTRAKHLSLNYDIPPLAIGGLMVVSGDPLIAHDVATGRQKWSVTGGAAATERPLIHAAGLLFFPSGTYDGDFVGLDPATGKEAWRSRLGGRYDKPRPVAADGRRVYVIAEIVTGDAKETPTVIAAVDIKTRKVLWQKQRGEASGDWDVEATADGRHVVYTDNLYNLTVRDAAHGAQLWTKPVGDDAAARPTVFRDKVIIGGATMRAFDLKTGAERWSLRTGHRNPFEAPLTLVGTTLYASVYNGGVWAVAAATGKKLWKSDDLGRRPVPEEFVQVGNTVYGATALGSGGIHAFEARTGKLRWTYHDSVHDDGRWHIAAAGRRLLVAHSDRLYGLPAV